MAALDQIISEWARAKRIHEFFDELETAIDRSPEENKALLHDRLRSAREVTMIPAVLDSQKSWKTPEETYEEKKTAVKLSATNTVFLPD